MGTTNGPLKIRGTAYPRFLTPPVSPAGTVPASSVASLVPLSSIPDRPGQLLGLRAVGWPHRCRFRRIGKLPPLTTPLTHSVAQWTVGTVDHPVMGAIISYEFI